MLRRAFAVRFASVSQEPKVVEAGPTCRESE